MAGIQLDLDATNISRTNKATIPPRINALTTPLSPDDTVATNVDAQQLHATHQPNH
jgi:hypothetical protein